MTDNRVTTIEGLEEAIGKFPPSMHLKVIDHLDTGALEWLGKSPLMFAAIGDGRNISVTAAGGAPGFAGGDRDALHLPLAAIDHPDLLRPGVGFGALSLLPGIGETLRVNGTVASIDGGVARISVQECYGHCAKALIRSEFWSPDVLTEPPAEAGTFVDASRFMALATVDPTGRADLSPKGDPAGTMAMMEEGGLWFAERPGNRRADSLRNLIAQPRLAALLLIPGSTLALQIGGMARISRDEGMRQGFAVKDKVPALVTRVEEPEMRLYDSGALARAALWPMIAPTEGVDGPGLFLAHIKLNRSLGAKVAGTILSLPGMDGVMRKGLAKDYKDNLY